MSIYLYNFFKINLDDRLIYPAIGKNKQNILNAFGKTVSSLS